MAQIAIIDPASGPALSDKVAFLSRSDAYPGAPGDVVCKETHMSWVFLAGERVYKLKKPVRFPYLDFSTLDRREAACRAELRLNRRLARDVYLEVAPLTETMEGLRIGAGDGTVVDWLVVMRRLDPTRMLDHILETGGPDAADLERMTAMLAAFFRRATPVMLSPLDHLMAWRRSVAYNRAVLLDRRLHLPDGIVRAVDRIQRRFLDECGGLLGARVLGRHIVDGHGDLRPEHIWLGDPPSIIDCLEFNAGLRANDPFDEIAFLTLECARLGNRWAAERLHDRMLHGLSHPPPEPLFVFYRSHRAMLRARLAIAHLLEPDPRTPEKWPAVARSYLRFAAADARRLAGFLRR